MPPKRESLNPKPKPSEYNYEKLQMIQGRLFKENKKLEEEKQLTKSALIATAQKEFDDQPERKDYIEKLKIYESMKNKLLKAKENAVKKTLEEMTKKENDIKETADSLLRRNPDITIDEAKNEAIRIYDELKLSSKNKRPPPENPPAYTPPEKKWDGNIIIQKEMEMRKKKEMEEMKMRKKKEIEEMEMRKKK